MLLSTVPINYLACFCFAATQLTKCMLQHPQTVPPDAETNGGFLTTSDVGLHEEVHPSIRNIEYSSPELAAQPSKLPR